MPDESLTILLYGDFHEDRLGASYRRAFEGLGHRVVPLDIRTMRSHLTPWMVARLGHRLTIRNLALRRVGSRAWNNQILKRAEQAIPHLTLVLNGEFLMPETVSALRRLGSRIFIFHADNPFPENSSSRPEDLPCALESDCYFIWSHVLANRLCNAGVPRVEYLPFAWDQNVFPFLGQSHATEHDLVFVGGWDVSRERALEPLARRFNLKIWGPPYWASRTARNSAVRRSWQGASLTGREAARVIASARITLNILRQQNMPDGTVMRTFEVPGSGGMALSTRTQGAVDIFPEGVAGAYFTGMEECAAQIEYLLGHPARSRELSGAAHEIVSRYHQYRHRASLLLKVYSQLDA